jgi:pyruvate/2-oxoglutarate dehydrogenase complex dihydrolipoamide acyltransferase (E2) component
MSEQKIIVPNIGDFKEVEVIEVLVKEGQEIKKDESVITLESDKSSVEVPSNFSGKIKKINVNVGDKISEGTTILSLEIEEENKNKAKLISKNLDNDSENKNEIIDYPTNTKKKNNILSIKLKRVDSGIILIVGGDCLNQPVVWDDFYIPSDIPVTIKCRFLDTKIMGGNLLRVYRRVWDFNYTQLREKNNEEDTD